MENESPRLEIPCLPGYIRDSSIRTDFQKRHYFDIGPDNDAALPPSGSVQQLSTNLYPSFMEREDVDTGRAPIWMSNSGLICRFFMYQPNQKYCTKFVLCFYLEDGSMSIGQEPDRTRPSSGPPPRQVQFLRRHRVPLSGTNRNYRLDDMAIGKDIIIYGRAFRIYDADRFTRSWFCRQAGKELGPAEPSPDTNELPVESLITTIPRTWQHFDAAQAQLSKPTSDRLQATKQFLNDDGAVLRFWVQVDPPASAIVWDENRPGIARAFLVHPDQRPIYVLRHFLADDTTELVLSGKQRQIGQGFSTTLIKRCLWPIRYQMASMAMIGETRNNLRSSHIQMGDLSPGRVLTAFGRRMLILRADAFTASKIGCGHSVEEIDDGRPC